MDQILADRRRLWPGELISVRLVLETRPNGLTVPASAVQQGIITQEEHDHLVYTDRLRREVVKVDDHEPDLSRAAMHGEDSWQADSRKKAAVASF